MKGVSPLIASVLLIVLTIGVSVLILPSFTKQASEPLQESKTQSIASVDCAQTHMQVLSVDTSGGQLVVTVQNTGQKTLERPVLYATVPEGTKDVNYSLVGTLGPGAVFKLVNTTFPYAFADRILVVSPQCSNVRNEKDLGFASPQLLGWWKFDEGSGTALTDISGKANNGWMQTTGGFDVATWTTGKEGNALQFDGHNDTVLIPTVFRSRVGSKTVEAWGYLTASDDVGSTILATRNQFGYPNPGGYIFGLDSSRRLAFSISNSSGANEQTVTASSSIGLNTWTHLAMTYDASTKDVKLYVNGSSVTTTGTITYDHPAGVYETVGGDDPDPNSNGGHEAGWIGKLDEVRFYERVLTAEEIKALYEGYRPI